MIDLADYTKPIRDQLRKGEFAAVYVVTSEVGIHRTEMSRVGYALDLVATVSRLQASSPAKLTAHAALWVPNRAIATNIARAVQCDMMPIKRASGWYEAPGATMERAVELAAFRIHPGATMLWHGELLKRWLGQAA
ncbi:hypothetical protein QIH87_14215 [Bradyrhizobium elkanii]|uniref:hypothetical protein n=1 Tax=Bradyrhizobium elkanii TaxID=29448 RepID=UPI0010218FCE|nr:hypothetical protein [Bradyrhizobium elkanii]MCW2112487.1 hypothetical protein [Bradyrhizobium elkanii]MCW2199156.1 hypothetical protein [Bradyrhizobium elkanii]MCW2229291.1 hypothetical protein [Bradyrhizobium elkanii]NWL38101.1 hypothetical protein [Bradyrhizobium elkanii]RYM15735.1 hypothetical protein EWH13_38500 [Bradyrhizobium elkanii]